MSTEPTDGVSDEERRLFGAYDIAAELASQCRRVREMAVPTREAVLDAVVNTLMTEFWDCGFSQAEIRHAFAAALDDMNRYAAGNERRQGSR
jgi:hypothetical protein